MEWQLIEDKYEVSDSGKIRSNGELILRTRFDRYGYEVVTLWIAGKCLTKKVHRLVAIAFIPNPNNLATVNHKDGIKTNNTKDNLEWNSVLENHQHAFATGLHTIGEHRIAGRPVKLVENDIIEIRKLIADGFGNTEIGKMFKVSCGCIYSIRIGKSWKHI